MSMTSTQIKTLRSRKRKHHQSKNRSPNNNEWARKKKTHHITRDSDPRAPQRDSGGRAGDRG
jgi:hypothetical protein